MRKNGKTTRLVDEAIQVLFTKGKICVPYNHWLAPEKLRGADCQIFIDSDSKRGNVAQECFRDVLLRRLYLEHIGYFRVDGRMIFANEYL